MCGQGSCPESRYIEKRRRRFAGAERGSRVAKLRSIPTLPRSLTSRYIARIKAKWLARAHPICSQRRQTLHDDPQRSRRGCHRGVGSGPLLCLREAATGTVLASPPTGRRFCIRIAVEAFVGSLPSAAAVLFARDARLPNHRSSDTSVQGCPRSAAGLPPR